MYVFAAGIQTLFNPSPFWVSKLGIMADVKYEDYGIITFPFYDENFTGTLTEIDEDYVELPTLKFTDFDCLLFY